MVSISSLNKELEMIVDSFEYYFDLVVCKYTYQIIMHSHKMSVFVLYIIKFPISLNGRSLGDYNEYVYKHTLEVGCFLFVVYLF